MDDKTQVVIFFCSLFFSSFRVLGMNVEFLLIPNATRFFNCFESLVPFLFNKYLILLLLRMTHVSSTCAVHIDSPKELDLTAAERFQTDSLWDAVNK